jgi:signal transduction histidine kinase
VEHADRLSTLGTLGASLAHELRNPLASISVFVQMLPERHLEPIFVEKFNRVVTAELDKLTHLTEQLLNLARPATRAPQVVDLGVLCQRLLQLVSFQFRTKEVRLTMDTPEGTLVQGVEEELSQVLLNLLLNALDASKAGSQVQVQLARPPGWAELRVLDQGPGLSQDQLARIFEPFFTTKEHGNGLGLATSQNIVQSFGGTLGVENRPEGGAVFTVRLPQADAGKVGAAVEPGWTKR